MLKLSIKKPKLLKWKRIDWKYFTIGSFFGILTSICGASLPFLLSKSEEIFQQNQPNAINKMLLIILLMFIIGMFGVLFSYFSKIFLSKLSSKNIAEIRYELFKKIQYLSPLDLKEQDNSTLLTRLMVDVYNYSLYYNWLLINVLPSFLRWIIFSIMAFVLNWVIGFVLLGMCFILYMVSFFISKKSTKFFEISLAKIDKLNKIIKENIASSRIIKSFNIKEKQVTRFNKVNEEARDYATKADIRVFSSWPFALAFINGTSIIIIFFSGLISWSGIQIAGAQVNVGTIVALSSYSYLILWSVFDFVFLYSYDSRSIVSRKRIKEIMNIEPININTNGTEFINGEIEFRNVYFGYSEASEYVLENINFKFPINSKIGIIGSIGSGKTTLMNLLTRVCEPTKGEILINGINIKDINTSSLLDNISFSFQKKLLFAGTIKENIKIGNELLNDDEIWKIVKTVQLEEFVQSKKEKLDYILEEQGNNLSGGQKQRISIARALAKKAKIYLFDDSTSALDNITESKIINEIKKNKNDSFLFMSSQKISSIKDMDQIIVLEEGKITSIGTHEELMKNDLIYKEIAKYQSTK